MVHRFQTTLVAGGRRPYNSWTFLVIPKRVAIEWGAGRKAVRGTISGHAFRATASKGEGRLRVPIPKELRDKTGLRIGGRVHVALELDAQPPGIVIPDELRSVLEDDRDLAERYAELPPSYRRAWAGYVAEARRAETRLKRAERARAGIRAREFPK